MWWQCVCVSPSATSRLRHLLSGLWWAGFSKKLWKAAGDGVESEEAGRIYPRHFDSIIHFCRMPRGCHCWEREASVKGDVCKNRNLLWAEASEANEMEDKRRKCLSSEQGVMVSARRTKQQTHATPSFLYLHVYTLVGRVVVSSAGCCVLPLPYSQNVTRLHVRFRHCEIASPHLLDGLRVSGLL